MLGNVLPPVYGYAYQIHLDTSFLHVVFPAVVTFDSVRLEGDALEMRHVLLVITQLLQKTFLMVLFGEEYQSVRSRQ